MAKYTTQIKSVVEMGVDIFDFDYPIFDEKYRPVLEKKIIDHYYFREIGLETVGQFKWFLKDKLNRIMPYYNQLYTTEGLISKDDYWINLNMKEVHTREVEQNQESSSSAVSSTKGSSSGSGTGKNVFSDTPQAALQGKDYATNMTEDENTNTVEDSQDNDTSGSTSGTATTKETFTITQDGGGGLRYNADILMEWRKSFLNIDQQIIDELRDLFMNIY